MAKKRKIGILNRERLKLVGEEKKYWLKTLSVKKAIRLQESLLASAFIWEWRKNFFPDNPVCLKKILRPNR